MWKCPVWRLSVEEINKAFSFFPSVYYNTWMVDLIEICELVIAGLINYVNPSLNIQLGFDLKMKRTIKLVWFFILWFSLLGYGFWDF